MLHCPRVTLSLLRSARRAVQKYKVLSDISGMYRSGQICSNQLPVTAILDFRSLKSVSIELAAILLLVTRILDFKSLKSVMMELAAILLPVTRGLDFKSLKSVMMELAAILWERSCDHDHYYKSVFKSMTQLQLNG